jgi:hypothetical protein
MVSAGGKFQSSRFTDTTASDNLPAFFDLHVSAAVHPGTDAFPLTVEVSVENLLNAPTLIAAGGNTEKSRTLTVSAELAYE